MKNPVSSPEKRESNKHYSKLKKYMNDISGNSNSYTFKQTVKMVRDRIEACEKLTAEID